MENNINRNYKKHPEPGRFLQWLRKGLRGRRLLYVGGIFVTMIITLAALLVVLPDIPPFKQYILSFVDRHTSSLLLCKVTVGAITLDIRNGIIAKNIVLSDLHGRSKPISMQRLAAQIDLMALLRGRIAVRSIKITGLSGVLLRVHRGLFAGPVDIGRIVATIPVNTDNAAFNSKPLVQMVSAEHCTVSFIDSITNITALEVINAVRLKFIRTDSISFTMQAGAGHFSSPVWSGGVRSNNIQGTVGPASLLFSNAELQGDSVVLSLHGTIPFTLEKVWNLVVNVETFVAGFPNIFKSVSWMRSVGKLKADGVMSGTIVRPILNVAFTGYGLQAGTLSIDSLFLQTHYSDDRFLGKSRLWSPAGTIDASVNADIIHLFLSPVVGRYTIAAAAENIDVRNFISKPPQWRYQPAFSADAGLYAAGSGLHRLPDTIAADIREVTRAIGANPMKLTARMAGSSWSLTAGMEPDFKVSGNGRYTARGSINGSFHAQADTLRQIASMFLKESVRGSLTADALLSGTIRNPAVSATVSSTNLSWRDIQVLKLWGRFTLRNKRLRIDSSSLEATGLLANALQVASLSKLPGEFNGKAWIQAGASGPLDSLRIDGDLQIRQFSYDRYHADTVSLHCRYADQSLQWQSLIAKRAQSAMMSDGMVSWATRNVSLNAGCKFKVNNDAAGTLSAQARLFNNTVEASVTAEGLDPAIVSPWFPPAQRLAGSLGIHGTMAGATGNPEIRLLFSFDRTVSDGLFITTNGNLAFADSIATVTIKLGQKGFEIPLTITAHIPVAIHDLSKGVAAMRDGAVVTVNGDSVAYGGLIDAFVPSIKASGTISLKGAVEKANGAWGLSCSTHIVNNRLTVEREEIKAGHGVLDLHISGPLVRPVARFSLSGESIEYRGNLITSYAGKGSIVNDAVKLDTLHLSCSEGGADLSALVPVSLKNGFTFGKNGSVSATFTAMPFGIAQPFMPDPVTINKGTITGRVIIKGTAKGVPQAAGTLSLQKIDCYISECDKPLGPLSADIDFKNDSIILRRLQADWGRNGRIAGSGWAVLGGTGVSAAKSTIKISNVRLGGCYENLDLDITSADINFTKDSLFTVTANFLLGDTRYIQDFSLVDIGEQLKKKAPQAPRPLNPLFNNVVMRIAVNLNSNLTFNSNLGKMLVDGAVTVAGRPDKPSIDGQFQILNGFVYYLDRKFTVMQGTIRQYDPQRINPSLNVTATSRVSWYPPQGGKTDYDITLLIKGDLSDPLITISAIPSLAQPQIISLLTFGTIQTGVGSDIGSRTGGAMVSQQLAGFGTRKLARLLNVESVDLYGNVFDTASAGPQLSVTKQVSSRVAVTYRAGLSKFSRQMVQVSYRILSFLYLEAETDQHAQGGIDLKFRYSR